MEWKTIALIVAGMVFAFFVTFAITPIVRKISIKTGAVDIPKDERRMHNQAIPTMGGLAIFIAFAVGVLAFVPLDKTYIVVIIGALVITCIGMMDDIFGLKWWVKLLGQVGAALIVAVNGIAIAEIAHEPIGNWAIPATVLWIVAITNAINLIDGLDGLACGIVGISCVSLMVAASFYMEPQYQSIIIVIAVLAGSCFGFLPYNINPAKIFMGDTGAMLIGFAFSVISIQGFFKVNAIVTFGIPFLVLGLPILDTLLAIFRRLVRKQHFFKPDKQHLHHRMIDIGFNQRQTVALMYTISGVLGLAAILIVWRRSMFPLALGIIVAALAIGLIVINRRGVKTRCEEETAQIADRKDGKK